MTALALDYAYRYACASEMSDEPQGPRLRLATFGGVEEHPYFFQGRLLQPKQTADLLRGLMEIVHARFHIPAAMLTRILALADPVVTSSELRLRFEGFSACCSAYARVDLQTWDFPRLRESIGAPKTLDDLIDAAAAALEGCESADDVELILDGVSRLCDQRPGDFERRTGPLRKRTLQRLMRQEHRPFCGGGIAVDLIGLVWAWLTSEFCQTTQNGNQENCSAGGESWTVFRPSQRIPLLEAFSRRALAVAQRAANRVAMPLLSAPTHQGGWIDPVALVGRLQQPTLLAAEVPEFERTLALLRLAPEHRDAALSALGEPGDEFSAALCYALGGEAEIGPTPSLWAAAARARAPWCDDPHVELRHPLLGPDTGAAGRIELEFHAAQEHPGKVSIHHRPARGHRDLDAIPTLLLHGGLPRLWLMPDGPLIVRWTMTVWPAWPAPAMAAGARHLLRNLDWTETLWSNRCYLERLLDPDVAIPPIALLALTAGLAAKEPSEVGTATDAVIAAIDDGRLGGSSLGKMLRCLLTTGQVKPTRWAKTLAAVARVSLLHAETVRAALASVFQGETATTKELSTLLELFKELTVETNQPIGDCARQWLGRVSGSGKGAKAAKALGAFQHDTQQDRRPELWTQALAGRFQRVRRWSG